MATIKPRHFIFRYFSSRGTDCRIAVTLPPRTSNKEALERAKQWAEERTAGTACHEYTVTVRPYKPLTRKVWLLRWDKVCDRYEKVSEQRKDLQAMNNAYDWTRGRMPRLT